MQKDEPVHLYAVSIDSAEESREFEKKIAADVQPQQRQAFHDAFAALRTATRSGKAGLTQMPELLQSYRDAIGDQKVDGAELTDLTNAARSAATPKRER